MTNTSGKTALILGSNGRFGRHACIAFKAGGWQVKTYQRGTSMTQAAQGADVIVNGLNPAYTDWVRDMPGITRDVIAAAKSSGATVLIPGNVYNFGTLAKQPWSEDSPQSADTHKGKMRIEMEQAYAASGVQTINLRAGDFIDVEQSGNWYENHMAKDLAKGRLMYPGPTDQNHAWCYLPDVARAAEILASKRAELGVFENVHFPGYTLTGAELQALLSKRLGQEVKLTSFPWWFIKLVAPFWGLGRELLEMRYIWQHPHALDGEKFAQLCPGFVHTDPGTAFTALLQRDVNPDKAMVRADRFA